MHESTIYNMHLRRLLDRLRVAEQALRLALAHSLKNDRIAKELLYRKAALRIIMQESRSFGPRDLPHELRRFFNRRGIPPFGKRNIYLPVHPGRPRFAVKIRRAKSGPRRVN